jgi:cellulase/cellobiase CelA1
VTYQADDWGGGFTARMSIANTGSAPISGWTLTFAFPGNQRIANGWSANWTQPSGSAEVTATSQDHNRTIGAGASVADLGFNAGYTGTNAPPTRFALNGQTCT